MKLLYLLVIAVLATIIVPLAQHKTFAAKNYAEVEMESGSADPNSGKGFVPKALTVSVGTTVKWENSDSAGHTVTSGKDTTDPDFGKLFDSAFPLIKPGAGWEHTFDKAGEFPYFCQVHPWMIGKIIVTETGAQIPQSQETPSQETLPQMTATTPEGVEVALSWVPATIEPGKEIVFTLKFFDKSGNPINNALYDFIFIREGAHIIHRSLQPIAQGTSLEKVTFKQDQTGPVTLRLQNINLTSGEDVEFSLQIVPEFPFSMAIVMASVFAIAAMVNYRYGKLLKKWN